jgi:hypothetical protein
MEYRMPLLLSRTRVLAALGFILDAGLVIAIAGMACALLFG